MNNKIIRYIVKKNEKKIGKDAITKIVNLLEEKTNEIIIKAVKKADFAGRKIIKKEDIK